LKGGIELMNSVYWLIVLAVLIFIEILTLDRTTIWFAGGAVVAFIVSLFNDNLLLEVVLFMVVSVALFYFIRPLVLKYFGSNRANTNQEVEISKEKK